MTPLILNTNFIKRESEIGYPQVSHWDSPDREPTVITTKPRSTYSMIGSLKLLYTHLQSIKPQQKPTTICLIICKPSTHTKLHHPARCCVGLRERNSRKIKMELIYQITRWIGLTLVNNNRVIAQKSWMARCSPRAPRFQPKL